MPEKYIHISDWSNDDLVKLAWLDDDDAKRLPEKHRKDLGAYKRMAQDELERRGFKAGNLRDLPSDLTKIIAGDIGDGRKAEMKRLYVSNEEFDTLLGGLSSTRRPQPSKFVRIISWLGTSTNRSIARLISLRIFQRRSARVVLAGLFILGLMIGSYYFGISRSPKPHYPIIGNRRTRIYHWYGCPNYYDITPENQLVFATSEDAEARQFRPAGNCSSAPPRSTPH
jgi:hypothetical protein